MSPSQTGSPTHALLAAARRAVHICAHYFRSATCPATPFAMVADHLLIELSRESETFVSWLDAVRRAPRPSLLAAMAGFAPTAPHCSRS